ncbi:hypothetical protein ABT090_36975 [Streptomyces asoensis]|uniref:hypothetical protein n=1 Tax=Streptomyces asoensis TaxID=249586 RepID=UPI00332A3A82
MNDDGVEAPCACIKRLEGLHEALLSLARQAGLDPGELAAQANRSPATVRRWFREPDLRSAEKIGLLVQVCLDRLHREDRQSAPQHLGEAPWWREQLQTLHMNVLFGVCAGEPRPAAPIHTRLFVKAVTPIVRQVPLVTSMMAVVLFTYALVVVTVGPDVPVRRPSSSAVAPSEASDQKGDGRQEGADPDADGRRKPPAADRTGRLPLAGESAEPALPDLSDGLVACRSLLAEYYDGVVVLVLCPGRGAVVFCWATLSDRPARRLKEAAPALARCRA